MVNADKYASLLRQAHENLVQGRVEESKMLLTTLIESQTEPTSQTDYLLAWIAAEQSDWEEAAKYLNTPLFIEEIRGSNDWLSATSVRRRRPGYLLRLAAAAHVLGYPHEAIAHGLHGLKLLDERRMNVPEVRLQIHILLGRVAIETSDAALAVSQYETALALSQQDQSHALLATVYEGLCEAYLEYKHFPQAIEAGKQGILLLDDACKSARKERLLLLLSRCSSALHDFEQAHAWVQQASDLANASEQADRKARTLLALANLSFAEGNWDDARQNCSQAAEIAPDDQLQGDIALLRGRTAEAEWNAAPQKKAALADEAMTFYKQAQQSFTKSNAPTAAASIVEVSARQGRLLENRGQATEALAFWKTAYELGANLHPATFDE